MRFAPHWDALLMSEISLLRNKRSILTTYPDGYEAGGGLDSSIYTVISPLKFDLERVLSLMGLPRPVPREAAPPCPGAFASACFLFGPVQAFEDVPRSALISQYVEEFILSILLWSHGWNVYHPRRAILYHQWKKSHRSLNLFLESKLSSSFSQRLLVALEQPSGQLDDVLASMLPMGCERSASQFLERTQLNFKERTIGNSAGAGWYDESSASGDLSTAVLMARPFQP
jgi:hypothetical protein